MDLLGYQYNTIPREKGDPEPAWVFKSDRTLEELLILMNAVADAHRMAETLQKEEEFTGEWDLDRLESLPALAITCDKCGNEVCLPGQDQDDNEDDESEAKSPPILRDIEAILKNVLDQKIRDSTYVPLRMAESYEIESQQDHPTHITHSISPAMELEFVSDRKHKGFWSVHNDRYIHFTRTRDVKTPGDWECIKATLQKIAESVSGDPDAKCYLNDFAVPLRFIHGDTDFNTQIRANLGEPNDEFDKAQSVTFTLRITGLEEQLETRPDGTRWFGVLYEIKVDVEEFQPGPKTVRTIAL